MSVAEEARKQFRGYFKAAHTEGVLDAKTKKLMHLTLVLANALRALSGSELCRGKEDGHYR